MALNSDTYLLNNFGICLDLETFPTKNMNSVNFFEYLSAPDRTNFDINKINELNKIMNPNTAPTKAKFIVASFHPDRGFSVASKPREHDTLSMAQKEAERLALAAPGTTYTVLRVEGNVKTGGVSWS